MIQWKYCVMFQIFVAFKPHESRIKSKLTPHPAHVHIPLLLPLATLHWVLLHPYSYFVSHPNPSSTFTLNSFSLCGSSGYLERSSSAGFVHHTAFSICIMKFCVLARIRTQYIAQLNTRIRLHPSCQRTSESNVSNV